MLNIHARRTAGETVQTALGMGGAEQAQETATQHSGFLNFSKARSSCPSDQTQNGRGYGEVGAKSRSLRRPKIVFPLRPSLFKSRSQ